MCACEWTGCFFYANSQFFKKKRTNNQKANKKKKYKTSHSSETYDIYRGCSDEITAVTADSNESGETMDINLSMDSPLSVLQPTKNKSVFSNQNNRDTLVVDLTDDNINSNDNSDNNNNNNNNDTMKDLTHKNNKKINDIPEVGVTFLENQNTNINLCENVKIEKAFLDLRKKKLISVISPKMTHTKQLTTTLINTDKETESTKIVIASIYIHSCLTNPQIRKAYNVFVALRSRFFLFCFLLFFSFFLFFF